MLLFLLACHHQPYNSATKEVCVQACERHFKECQVICRDNCNDCAHQAYQQAADYYERYKRERCVQGQMITQELKSFIDPLQCRKTTCDCQADKNSCLQSCKGIIYKKLKVVPTCC